MIKHFIPFLLVVFISLQVFSQSVIVSSNPTMKDRFSKRLGSLRLSTTLLKIGKIKNNATKSDTIHIYNEGSRNLSLALGKIPESMDVNLGAATLSPQKETWIAVTYHAARKNDYGFMLDRFELITDDSVLPKKSISVSTHIQEYFAPMTSEDSLNVQKSKWIETTYDYGKIRQGSKITHNYAVTNEGKRDLYIRKKISNCSCLKISTASDTIPPGTTANFLVEFDSANKEGKDSRKMNIILNDPARPEVVLEIKGEIEK